MLQSKQEKTRTKKMAQDVAVATLESFSAEEDNESIDPFSMLEEFTENN